ncbi:hypothetical protein ElyMa_005119100 [Elysia marginata]|uniref:TGF-beta family profile domain-containing protein n=1 Tax=Elysia marginata TaxID=1093978 RepID=A0AAV4JKJ2_9GAST|nr:hypothetical protein ElyMa_005119100 [Elysia marginata]
MAPTCLVGLSQCCERWWFKLIVIVLFIAILVAVSITGSNRFLSAEESDRDNGRETFEATDSNSNGNLESQDASHIVSSQNSPRRRTGGYTTDDDNNEEEYEDIDLDYELSEDSEDYERGVRKVRDLPLMVVKQNLNNPSRSGCPHNICPVQAEALKRFQRRKAFLYLKKLHRAVETETQLADEREDPSSANWSIRGYSPVLRTRDSVVFKRTVESFCKVTHLELLVGFKCRNSSLKQDYIFASVNEKLVTPTTGTFAILNAAVFDLNTQAAVSDLNITFKNHNCFSAAQVCHSMLFEYCNINKTVLRHFQVSRAPPTHSQASKAPKFDPVQPRHSSGLTRSWEDIQKLRKERREYIYNKEPIYRELMRNRSKVIRHPDLDRSIWKLTASVPSHPVHPGSTTSKPSSSAARSTVSSSSSPSSPSPPASGPAENSSTTPIKRRVSRDVSCKPACQDSSKTPAKTCARQELKVNLIVDMKYPLVIPATPVDIGMCQGTCIHACHMGQAGEKITAHAVLLNKLAGTDRAAERWGAGMRMSSCVPNRMKTISVLRIDANHRTEILNWANMVVDSCRCA